MNQFECKRSPDISVDRGNMLRYLGYNKQDLSSELKQQIDKAIEVAEQAASPIWCFGLYSAWLDGDTFHFNDSNLVLSITKEDSSLRAAKAFACMACTLGFSFEREIRRLCIEAPSFCYLVDAAGSSLCEGCADSCEQAIGIAASNQNLFPGQRFSPGYGVVPLRLSRDIISELTADRFLGISVTENDLLIPQKSLTAFVPLFSDEDAANRAYRSCIDCALRKSCSYLAQGITCYRF